MNEVIRDSFGGDIAVLARKPKQFSSMLKNNPFRDPDGTKLHFALLATEPDKKLLKKFLSTDFSPDQVRYVDRTIYALYSCPTKHGYSRLNNNYFET